MARYTKTEREQMKAALLEIRAGGFVYRTSERGAAFRAAISDLAKKFGRTENAVRAELYRIDGSKVARKRSSGMIVRGSRKFTPQGLASMQRCGKSRWEKSMQRLRAYGLTDEQIKAAFSTTKVKLSKDVVSFIEQNLEGKNSETFKVFKSPSGAWDALVVSYANIQDLIQDRMPVAAAAKNGERVGA